VTNVDLSAEAEILIKTLLNPTIPGATIHVLGAASVCAWIDNAHDLALRFPQLFSLADILHLLQTAARPETYARSQVAIEMATNIARVFVPTSPYYASLNVLKRHHFVVLEGPPEMGKTSIGRMIALGKYQSGCDAIEVGSPTHMLSILRTERRQVFVADDSFGRTSYNATRVSEWQQELPYILRKLNASHELILTSRAHLLQMAKSQLDISGFNDVFPAAGEVIVNAADLSRLDKARILYRHAKLARLCPQIKEALRPIAKMVVDDVHFTPERIRLLVNRLESLNPDE
jgi:hypothetical protein